MRSARELAEEHWLYTSKIMKLMYVEAFVHGVKHGKEMRE